jgi:hypothetical protein
MQKRKATASKYRASIPHKGVEMFEKTIVDIWFDPDTFNQFLISVDDEGTLFLTEKKPEVVR